MDERVPERWGRVWGGAQKEIREGHRREKLGVQRNGGGQLVVGGARNVVYHVEGVIDLEALGTITSNK